MGHKNLTILTHRVIGCSLNKKMTDQAFVWVRIKSPYKGDGHTEVIKMSLARALCCHVTVAIGIA